MEPVYQFTMPFGSRVSYASPLSQEELDRRFDEQIAPIIGGRVVKPTDEELLAYKKYLAQNEKSETA